MAILTEEQKAKRRENYQKNKVTALEKMKIYRDANPELIKKRKRIYYAKNRDRLIEKSRKYQAENKEIISEGRREHYEKNRDLILAKIDRASRRKYNQAYFSKPFNRIKSIIRKAELRAVEKNFGFDQAVYDFCINIPTHCKCCGVELDYSMGNGKTRKSTTPSLDRRDNTRGYTIDNVAFICFKCNTLKSDASLEDIINIHNYIKPQATGSDVLLV